MHLLSGPGVWRGVLRKVAGLCLAMCSSPALGSCSRDESVAVSAPKAALSQPASSVRSALVEAPVSTLSAKELLAPVNALRAGGVGCDGRPTRLLPALKWDERLTSVAEAHARDMVQRGYFNHESPDGTSPRDRARKAGIKGPLEESLAWGPRDAADVLEAWRLSRSHCNTLLRSTASAMGATQAIDRKDKRVWVALVGLSQVDLQREIP